MKNINFKDFNIDADVVAKSIYVGQDRKISKNGIEISGEINQELTIFLQKYIEFLNLSLKKTFFRIDAYFDNKNLYILDMNASFVDGWGSALNLARAIGQQIDSVLIRKFPKNLKLEDNVYKPEFDLCLKELNVLFFNEQVTGYEVPDFNEIYELNSENETYVYGNTDIVRENIYPYNGKQIDDKINLARFSREWKGDLVKIPEIILPTDLSYQQLPSEIVLKIASKNNIRPDGRNKVFIGKPKKWGKMWEEGLIVAQERINPTKNINGENTQAIILSVDSKAVTGYLQNSTRDIINDDSVQSPLVLKS
ncbi:hypothetical protein EOM39_00985 [Candidatus Gracilibacteria bacterium]|nr:hypothetical protein [Candidatus Gracilibacteria bacterium]